MTSRRETQAGLGASDAGQGLDMMGKCIGRDSELFSRLITGFEIVLTDLLEPDLSCAQRMMSEAYF